MSESSSQPASSESGSPRAEVAVDVDQREARVSVEIARGDGEGVERGLPAAGEPTRVRVLDEFGRAVIGARAELRAHVPEVEIPMRASQLQTGPATPLEMTDEDGALVFRLERRAVCWVETLDGRSGDLLVLPGEDATLQLEGPPRRATFLDVGSRAPIVGRTFPVAVRRGARRTMVLLTTDGAGRVALPCGPCELQVCKSEPRMVLAAVELVQGEASAPAAGFHVTDFVAAGTLRAEDRELVVLVRNEEHELRLIDAATGAPIEGNVYAHSFSARDANGTYQGPIVDHSHRVRDGVLVIGDWFAAPRELSSTDVRWLAIAGYEVASFGAEVALRGAEVRLHVGPKRALRVVDAEGRALGGRFAVATFSGPAYGGQVESGELVGPFPWSAGDAWQFAFAGLGEPRTVSAAELAGAGADGAGIVTVSLAVEQGALIVEGVPEGAPPLFALSALEEWREVPVRNGRGDLAGLPAGPYCVGTRAWIDASGRSGGLDALGQLTVPKDRVIVQGGEVARIGWNAGWWQRDTVRGQVTCDEVDSGELLVLPITGSLEVLVAIGPATPWLLVDPDGRFSLPAGGARPEGFAFGRYFDRSTGAEPAILDVQPRNPSGRYVLRTTSFELSAAEGTGAAGRKVYVSFVIDPAELSAPARALGPGSFVWDTGERLALHGLPRHVSALRLLERGKRVAEVLVRPGAYSRVEVALPPAVVAPTPEPVERRPFGG